MVTAGAVVSRGCGRHAAKDVYRLGSDLWSAVVGTALCAVEP